MTRHSVHWFLFSLSGI